MGRLTDAMLTTDPAQRLRLVQSWLALLFTASGAVTMNYFVEVGLAAREPVLTWTLFTLGGAVVLFAMVRSGWSHKLSDPALTLPQIVFSLGALGAAYAIAGEGRGAVFPAVMVTLMFGIFRLRAMQMAAICLLAVALLAASMAWSVARDPTVYRAEVEWGHLFMVATMMPAVAALAWRLSAMQRRLREQRQELTLALTQLGELATCDELTGLPNRRFMQEQMARHLERATRTGREFCLVLLDVDHFKSVNDRFGHAMGDTVLATLAREMISVMREADELGRWGGEEFVVLMPDSNADEAAVGVERLRRRVHSTSIVCQGDALTVTVSAGIAQSHAGESIAQTLERADQALYSAKSSGRNCAVVAGPTSVAAPPPGESPEATGTSAPRQ